ncbi:hypothetical protein [Nocardiopsis ansamitocini]|nr:hypothetical protein [Nocardiopsis ansamitocini]
MAGVRYGYLPPAEPAATALTIAGTVSSWALLAAACLFLALRLSIGLPRFPPRYRGRRRARG